MSPIGIMLLVHPAVLLLTVGTALAITGVTWLFLIRKFPRKPAIWCSIGIFIITLTIYSVLIYCLHDMSSISIQLIRGL